MKQLILVFLGGGIGTVLRFIISKLITHNDRGFPWSTFSANLIGCFIIGLISGYFSKTSSSNQSDIIFVERETSFPGWRWVPAGS